MATVAAAVAGRRTRPLGISADLRTVPDAALTASSYYSLGGGDHYKPHQCRLGQPNGSSGYGRIFCPSPERPGEWVQVDMGSLQPACGAITQGYPHDYSRSCWKGVSFAVSVDGVAWTPVDGGRVWTRSADMADDAQLRSEWSVAYRCRYVRAVLAELTDMGKAGAPPYFRWEVLVLDA